MAFPSGEISVATVCDAYAVPRNMGALAGKTYYNEDGSSAIVPSININLNLFRGKYVTSPIIPIPSGNWHGVASSSDGTKLVTGGNNGYIYTSINSGISWTIRSSAGAGAWRGFACSDNGQYIVAGLVGGRIYFSADFGATWGIAYVNDSLSYTGNWYGFASSASGEKMVTGNANDGYIYTSTTYGSSWTIRSAPGTGNWNAFASSANGEFLVTGNGLPGQFYDSINYGSTWLNKPYFGKWSGFASSDSGVNFIGVTSDPANFTGKIFTGGRYIGVLTEVGVPQDWRGVACSSDGVKAVAVGYSGYIYTSVDSGATWQQRAGAGSRTWQAVASDSTGTKLVAVGNGFIYTSADSGATWTLL